MAYSDTWTRTQPLLGEASKSNALTNGASRILYKQFHARVKMISPMTLTARNANISFTEIKSLQRVKYSGWTSSNYENALAAGVSF